jgi:hypothetical protein
MLCTFGTFWMARESIAPRRSLGVENISLRIFGNKKGRNFGTNFGISKKIRKLVLFTLALSPLAPSLPTPSPPPRLYKGGRGRSRRHSITLHYYTHTTSRGRWRLNETPYIIQPYIILQCVMCCIARFRIPNGRGRRRTGSTRCCGTRGPVAAGRGPRGWHDRGPPAPAPLLPGGRAGAPRRCYVMQMDGSMDRWIHRHTQGDGGWRPRALPSLSAWRHGPPVAHFSSSQAARCGGDATTTVGTPTAAAVIGPEPLTPPPPHWHPPTNPLLSGRPGPMVAWGRGAPHV